MISLDIEGPRDPDEYNSKGYRRVTPKEEPFTKDGKPVKVWLHSSAEAIMLRIAMQYLPEMPPPGFMEGAIQFREDKYGNIWVEPNPN